MNKSTAIRLSTRQKLQLSLPFLILYLCSLLLCIFTPLCAEDYWHIVDGDFYQRFASAQNSFFTHNPRIGELIAYFLGNSTQMVHIIGSPLIIVSLAWGIYRLALFAGNKEKDYSLSPAIVACCSISLLCHFYSWYCSNINWLFPCALSLLFFYYFRRFFRGNFEISVKELVLGVPLYLLMGCGNEIVAYNNLVLLSLISIYYFIKDKKYPSKAYVLIGFIIVLGSLVFLFGLPQRAMAASNGASPLDKIATLLWIDNWILFGILFWKILIIIAALAFVLSRKILRQELYNPIIWLIISIFTANIILLTQAHCWGAPRGYQPLLILAAFYASYLTTKIQLVSSVQKVCLIVLISFITISSWLPISLSAIEGHYHLGKIKCAITAQKQEGKEHIVLNRELRNIPHYSLYLSSYRIPHFILPRVYAASSLVTDGTDGTEHYKLADDKRELNVEFAKQNGVKTITFEQNK